MAVFTGHQETGKRKDYNPLPMSGYFAVYFAAQVSGCIRKPLNF
jgi:hypothetical protein